jgi:hypothetical protein
MPVVNVLGPASLERHPNPAQIDGKRINRAQALNLKLNPGTRIAVTSKRRENKVESSNHQMTTSLRRAAIPSTSEQANERIDNFERHFAQLHSSYLSIYWTENEQERARSRGKAEGKRRDSELASNSRAG